MASIWLVYTDRFASRGVRNMDKLTIGIILASRIMREIERGSGRWAKIGGQSHGWKILHFICRRYGVSNLLMHDIVNGFLRAA